MTTSEHIRVAIIGNGLIGTQWESPFLLPLLPGLTAEEQVRVVMVLEGLQS